MRYLLDTHSLLWFLAGSPQLSGAARQAMEDTDNELLLSPASLWEIAIKISLGKLKLVQPFASMFPKQLDDNSIDVLPIAVDHLTDLTKLPFHHRDPFDRLLIAQAISEGLTIIGADAAFDAYGINRLW